MKLVDRPCPLCGAVERRPFLEEGGFAYVRCLPCGLVYLNPRIPDEDLRDHYQGYLPLDPAEIEAWRRSMEPVFLRSARILRGLVPSPGRILDVGTGFGFFPRIMADLGWDAEGLEISGSGADYAEKTLGVRVARAGIGEAGLPGESFDAVTAFYVIEHLPDPAGACREAFRLLRPGGALLLRWPHSAPLAAATRCLGLDLGLMHAPSHICQFSPSSIAMLLSKSGFEGIRTMVGGWTRPSKPLWRLAAAAGGVAAEAALLATGGRLLLPCVSKTTVAVKGPRP